MSSILNGIGKVGTRAIISGTVAGGLSYALLKRTDLVDIFGMETSHYIADAVLVLAGSAVGDSIGVYAVPWIADKFGASHSVSNFIEMTGSPIICGAFHLGAKQLIVNPKSQDLMKDFLLAGGSKLVGDKIAMAWNM